MQAPAIVQDDLARSGKLDHTLTEELRQRSRNGFEGQTQIIADIPTAHRERQHACYGEATIHFQQKSSYAFHRTLASEKQHMIFRVAKLAGGHGPKTAGNIDGDAGCPFQAPPLH